MHVSKNFLHSFARCVIDVRMYIWSCSDKVPLKSELKSIRAISISVESKGETFFSEIAATKRYLPF